MVRFQKKMSSTKSKVGTKLNHVLTGAEFINEQCSKTCYQHHGTVGGLCTAHSSCECLMPDRVSIMDTCDTYAE
jgi:hypothetical protein